VLPDHLNWLIRFGDGSLDELMRRIKARRSLAINRQRERNVRLWPDGYHDHGRRHEHDLKALIRHVLANPLRAGLVTRLRDYSHGDALWR
jgi:putative transposase